MSPLGKNIAASFSNSFDAFSSKTVIIKKKKINSTIRVKQKINGVVIETVLWWRGEGGLLFFCNNLHLITQSISGDLLPLMSPNYAVGA